MNFNSFFIILSWNKKNWRRLSLSTCSGRWRKVPVKKEFLQQALRFLNILYWATKTPLKFFFNLCSFLFIHSRFVAHNRPHRSLLERLFNGPMFGLSRPLLAHLMPRLRPQLLPNPKSWPLAASWLPYLELCWPILRQDYGWPAAAARPQILDSPAHKTVQYLAKFLPFFLYFSYFFDWFSTTSPYFPPRPPKTTRQTPNLAHRSAQGPQDRPARPSERAQDGVKIGQHGPRWAAHTADYVPSSPKDLKKRVHICIQDWKTHSRARFNADNAKKYITTFQKHSFFLWFSTFFAIAANVTSRPCAKRTAP